MYRIKSWPRRIGHADAQRLGLVYRTESGETITTDWKTDWSAKPRTADLPAPLKPNAGFPGTERL